LVRQLKARKNLAAFLKGTEKQIVIVNDSYFIKMQSINRIGIIHGLEYKCGLISELKVKGSYSDDIFLINEGMATICLDVMGYYSLHGYRGFLGKIFNNRFVFPCKGLDNYINSLN
jgi:hypothetical protein